MTCWLNAHPTIVICGYLLMGFVSGIVILKWPGTRSEEPVGTLLFSIIAWPLFLALGAVVLISIVLSKFLDLIGVEAHQSDTRGV